MGIDYNAYVYHGWKLDQDQVAEIVKRFKIEVEEDEGPDPIWYSVLTTLGINRKTGGLTYLQPDYRSGDTFIGVCVAELWVKRQDFMQVNALSEQDSADLAAFQKALDLPPPQMLLVGEVA